jgi:hypothetical protein
MEDICVAMALRRLPEFRSGKPLAVYGSNFTSTTLLAGGGFVGESRGVFGTVVEEESLVGAAIKMFSPTRPRRIGGISSATDQLRVRVLFISNC